MPTGPVLGIFRGKGVGPIRFGATQATVERLMGAPCDVRVDDVCRYIGRAVEFFFRDDVVHRIHVHRYERPAGKDAKGQPARYGLFNGAFPPDVQLGMLPWAVEEHVGKPLKVEPAKDGSLQATVELRHYEDMILEYDRLPNGNVVLGGVILDRDMKAPSAP
jgi:hypothetical protein